MKLDIRATIEFVGGAAVVLSLLFVGLQLRQGNTIAEREARSEIPFLTLEINRQALEEPEVALLLDKLTRSSQDLTSKEEQQAYSLAGMYLNLWAVTSSAVDSGFVPDYVIPIYLANVKNLIDVYPGLCPFLQARVTDSMRSTLLTFLSEAIAELDRLGCASWKV